MSYIRENIIEAHLVKEVKARGGMAYKFVSPSHSNVPDRLCVMPGGRIFFVECKAPGKTPRPGQRRELDRLRAKGAEVYELDSKDLTEIFPNG